MADEIPLDPEAEVTEFFESADLGVAAPTMNACAACRAPVRGAGVVLCGPCNAEHLVCPACGDGASEFLCRLCITRQVKHCQLCRRPPTPGSTLCAYDKEAMAKASLVGGFAVTPIGAADRPTEASLQAELDFSHNAARPRNRG